MEILSPADTYFGRIAFRNRLITQEQLGQAVAVLQQSPGKRLGEVLVGLGFLKQSDVDAILSIQDKQKQILSDAIAPAPPVTHAAPLAQAPAPASIPSETPLHTYSPAGVPVDRIMREKPSIPSSAPAVASKGPDRIAVHGPAKHLADLLVVARSENASDLHVSAGTRPFLRRYGRIVPIDLPAFQPADTERILFEVLSNAQKAQMLERQGLEWCLEVPGQGRYRACIIKQRVGWDGIFHIIRGQVPSFQELGLPDCLKRLTEYNQGLVLVTGPVNSGKTTTLAALIDQVNTMRDDHVITVENPVEYLHKPKKCQVTQREVGTHTDGFPVALRAALREDPDIIMVGELRDLDTLSMAITAAETGHLVFATLHTTSAARTVSRVVDGFPVGQQQQIRMMLSESLRGVVSQHLVPRKDGSGVALAIEILFVTPAVSALIRDNKPFQIPGVMQTGRKMGMCRLDDSLHELVESGVIDKEDAFRHAENKAAFQ
jgi:twitching motility protein PilT